MEKTGAKESQEARSKKACARLAAFYNSWNKSIGWCQDPTRLTDIILARALNLPNPATPMRWRTGKGEPKGFYLEALEAFIAKISREDGKDWIRRLIAEQRNN